MVHRDLHDVRRSTKRVSASAPSKLASHKHPQIVYLPIERLLLFPNNARTHSRKQLKQIARSIERFGFVNPVLISDEFEIIAGHGRVEAAKTLGLREVPTVRLSNLVRKNFRSPRDLCSGEVRTPRRWGPPCPRQ